ncbi:glycoside hydrolase [Kitasatospora sp. MMS16-BH015]|uniref:glycosyl hydrolase family 18 protein n=1 Tax=Kitasatospora sp. MMS16-BH015 TaxID=2018025 RepID=UPI000CA33EFB|nr:glycosyl hydrolase family 18 protein [Kitasatospora sp. MMS16-BH015]AUG81254.1 glycoside hydrolase [Kitasatospora sp. MMS16-BH015]
MRRRRYRLPLLAAGALLAPFLAVALPSAAHAATATAAFAKDQDWGTGYGGSYTINNATTSALNNWVLEFDLPAANSVASLWNATYTAAASHVTVKPPSWQTSIAPGGTYNFGFNIAYSGAYAPLLNCKLNGKPCDGSGTDTQPPTSPGNLQGMAGNGSASLSWTASSDNVGVAGYDVFNGSAKAATVTGTSATVSGLPAGTYSFTVVAFDAAGNRSTPAGPVSVTVQPPPPDSQPPTAPGTPTVTGTSASSVSLGWAASSDNVGVTAYDVYNGSALATTVTSTSATVGGLAADTPYTFTVKARDAAGNTSPASGAVTARTQPGGGPPGGALKIGYFTQWSIYARGYSVKQLDTSGSAARLSTLNYAFANIDPTSKKCFITNHAAGNDSDPNAGDGAGDAWADFEKGWDGSASVNGTTDTWDQPLAGNFNQLRQLKAKYPNLRIQISIGGWSYSKWFSDAAATDAGRKAMVSSCIDLYLKGNLPAMDGRGGAGTAAGIFDGIDLDWEWPNSAGHLGNVYNPADKANYVLLAQEFRRQLDALGATTGKHYTLSAFLPADPAKISAGIDIPGLFGQFDFATIQGYDYHGAWETTTNQQSALHLAAGDPGPFQFSSEIAVNAYVNGGAPKSKLTLGIPFYGRGWTGVPAGSTHGLFQTSTGPAPGTYENGYEDYHKLKSMATSGGYTIYRDPVAGYAYLYNGSVFYTYDDPTEMARKTAWIKQQGLAGAMVWSFDGDTPNGELMAAVDNGLK